MTCVNSRDTITQAAGRVLDNHYDYPDPEHIVTSHCRVAEGTWIAWKNIIRGDATGGGDTTPTGDTDKARWPANVASAYAIGVGFFPDDGSGPVVYELGVDPIFTWNELPVGRGESICGYWFVVGDVFELWGKAQLTSWTMNAIDVQIHSDGSNVWVVVLAQESVKYPFLYGGGHTDRCGIEHETMEELWAGGRSDPFFHDWDVGGYFWLYGQGVIGSTGSLFPGGYDDPGHSRSLRWQPARATVFAGDIGGFTLLDTIEAKFDNYEGGGGLLSGIEACASPAESGVLHLLWSEGGNFGAKGVDEKRGQRINYSRWDTVAKLVDTDLAYQETSGYHVSGDTLMPADQFVWTAEMIVRNDHGSPIAIVWPWIENDIGVQHLDLAEFWDLSSGTKEILQTLDPRLIPTPGEIGETPVQATGGAAGLASGFPPRRGQFASSLYTDPTLGHQDVYLVCAAYNHAVAFYRIPCDGSASFDYMDGLRQVGYSIVANHLGDDRFGFGAFIADFVSDPDNVWMPSETFGGGSVNHLYRRCIPAWELVPAFPVPDPTTGYESGAWPGWATTSPPAIVTDDAGDWLAGAGNGPTQTIQSTDPTDIAALRAKICRCCVPCAPLIIRTWHKLS